MWFFARNNFAHRLLIFVLLVGGGCIASNLSYAQSTRQLTGLVNLDVGPATENLTIDITVNNHSFVFAPIIGIIRPIQSSVTSRIQIVKGSFSGNYALAGIIDDPVDYTIELRCVNCADLIPRQYYSANGNTLGLANSAFIDPDELPEQLNITVISRAVIAGKVELLKPSKRDLSFTVDVVSANNPLVSLSSIPAITLAAGQTNTDYQVKGLRRDDGPFLVKLRCNNCYGQARAERIFGQQLSGTSNHADIDFLLANEGTFSLVPILRLLTED